MNKEGFRAWLLDENIYSSQKQVSDCLSRVRRAENALVRRLGTDADFDIQFSIDGGSNVRLLLSRRGMTQEMQSLNIEGLPVGTNQMDSIAAAVKKYFLFCEQKSLTT